MTANGALDTSFNSGGSGTNATVHAIAVQPADHKVVIGGSFTAYNDDTAAPDLIMRLNANGSRDTAGFIGGEGSGVLNTLSSDPEVVYALALQPDGRIVIGGDWFNAYSNDGITQDVLASDNLQRLNADGTLDTGFNYGTMHGPNHMASTPRCAPSLSSRTARSFWPGPLPPITPTAPPYGVVRVNPDGGRDPAFVSGVGSGVVNTINFNGDAVHALALQPDGKILLAGGMFNAYNNDGPQRFTGPG